MGKIVALGGGRFDNGEMDNVTEHIISLTGKKNPHFLPAALQAAKRLHFLAKMCIIN